MRRSDQWHVSGTAAALLALVLSPILILKTLFLRVFNIEPKTRDRTPGEVAGYLQDFIDGTGGEWDWDDFTSVPIADPRLEEIRHEAELLTLPLDSLGEQKLRELMVRARTIRPL